MKENNQSIKEMGQNPHKELCIRNRKSINIDGVTNIEAFDKDYVILELNEEKITLEGVNFKVKSLSQENGKIEIEGKVNAIYYSEKNSLKQSIFRRKR